MSRGTLRSLKPIWRETAVVTNDLGDEFTVTLNRYSYSAPNSAMNSIAIRRALAAGMPESSFDSDYARSEGGMGRKYSVRWQIGNQKV